MASVPDFCLWLNLVLWCLCDFPLCLLPIKTKTKATIKAQQPSAGATCLCVSSCARMHTLQRRNALTVVTPPAWLWWPRSSMIMGVPCSLNKNTLCVSVSVQHCLCRLLFIREGRHPFSHLHLAHSLLQLVSVESVRFCRTVAFVDQKKKSTMNLGIGWATKNPLGRSFMAWGKNAFLHNFSLPPDKPLLSLPLPPSELLLCTPSWDFSPYCD